MRRLSAVVWGALLWGGTVIGVMAESSRANEPCSNASEIALRAQELGEVLDLFQGTVQNNYRWAPTLIQDAQRARVEVSWLERVTESARVPCEFAERAFVGVRGRMRGLKNQYRVFSFFRREQPIEADWANVLLAEKALNREMARVREE